ncbi:hypothetical protein J7L68_04640 [bacterium]|nr:hypothetical protein [bacterium]
MKFTTNTSERMRITSTGNVGIGTTSPESRLTIRQDATLMLRNNSTYSTTGNDLAIINFGDAYSGSQARILVERGASGSGGDNPTDISFWNTPDGSVTLTERMRIRYDGNVGIGTTTPAEKLQVNGNMLMNAGPWSALIADRSMGFLIDPDNDQTGMEFQWFNHSVLSSNRIMRLYEDGDLCPGSNGGSDLGRDGTDEWRDLYVGGISLNGVYRTSWPSGADNLGNHSATQNLDMNNYNIIDAGDYTTRANDTHPKIVLDSRGDGDNWTNQGAHISIGESGDLGSASTHLTYVGDGYGYVGTGSVVSGVPSGGSYFRFHYNSNDIYTNSNVALAANATVDGCDISDYSPYFINSAGTNGQVWKSDGAGRGVWGTDATGADNLGNHTATANLNMTGHEVDDVHYYDVTAGNGYGLRFWGSNSYKIHMGNAAEYLYGPVTDYSIKTNMSNTAGRGWTWGVTGIAPIAAIECQTGNMQIAGDMTVSGADAYISSSTNACVHFGPTGKYGSANGWTPPNSSGNGIWIEQGAAEGGGFYADGNVACIWSPDYGLRVYDEDGMNLIFEVSGPGHVIPGDDDNAHDLGSATYSWRNLYIDGKIYADGSSPANMYLGTDASGNLTYLAGSGGGVTGSGTINRLPVWTTATNLGDSRLNQINTNSTCFYSTASSAVAVLSVYPYNTNQEWAIFGSSMDGDGTDGTSWAYLNVGGGGVMGVNEELGQYKAGVLGIDWGDGTGTYSENTGGVVGVNNDQSYFGGLSYRKNSLWYAGWFDGEVNITSNASNRNTLNVTGAVANPTSIGRFTNTYVTASDAYAVYAYSRPQDYWGYGGYFEGGWYGIKGVVNATGSSFYHGVQGNVSGATGGTSRAIEGYASGSGTKYGVYASASGAGTNYGIYATASGGATNYAGYFTGFVKVNSTSNPGLDVGNGSTGYVKIGSTGWYDDGSYFSPLGARNFYVRDNVPTSYIYSANTYLGSTSGDVIHFRDNEVNGNDWVINDAAGGKWGIGTTAPTAALHITGTSYDGTPDLQGTQIAAGIIELARSTYPYIDFNASAYGADYDARLIYNQTDDDLEIALADFEVTGGRAIILGGVARTTWPSGGGEWTDGGTYKYPNGNSAVRAYESGQAYGLSHYGTFTSYGYYGYQSSTGAGDHGIYSTQRTSTAATNYGYSTSIDGVCGHVYYGQAYHFGTYGYRDDDSYGRTGGVFGGISTSSPPARWGSLGYQNSGLGEYAVYGNAGYASGTGLLRASADSRWSGPERIRSGFAIGGYSEFMGGWINGELYGWHVKGDRYAQYSDGDNYITGIEGFLEDVGEEQRIVAYTNVSTDVTVSASGTGVLIGGSCRIEFDETFAKLASDEIPIVVTVSPTGPCGGIYIGQIDENGFSIIENNGGKSNVGFTWIAMARRTGYEERPQPPIEILAADFDANMQGVMHNENDQTSNAQSVYWTGTELSFTQRPETPEEIALRNAKAKFETDPMSLTDEEWNIIGTDKQDWLDHQTAAVTPFFDEYGAQIPPEWVEELRSEGVEMFTYDEMMQRKKQTYITNARARRTILETENVPPASMEDSQPSQTLEIEPTVPPDIPDSDRPELNLQKATDISNDVDDVLDIPVESRPDIVSKHINTLTGTIVYETKDGKYLDNKGNIIPAEQVKILESTIKDPSRKLVNPSTSTAAKPPSGEEE